MRKPKPNPLLEPLVLAKERANLVAGLLSEREPNAFEVLYTDFTQLVYGGGKVWFLPILDHRTRMVIGYAFSPSPDVRTALQAWERAKAFILTQKRERPKAIVHHDPGGAFLSHAWVGHLLLQEGQRLSYSLRGLKEKRSSNPSSRVSKQSIKTFCLKQSASKPSMRFWPSGSGTTTSTDCIQVYGTKRPKKRLKKP